MAKYLVHNYKPKGEDDFITLQLDTHWFRMWPGEPVEIDMDSNGRKLENPDFYAFNLLNIYGPIYGIVEVPQTKDRTGVHLDLERAIEMADASLLGNRHRLISMWAQDQLEGRVRQNLPVLPPTGFVAESIAELNIDVQAKFGFRPLGWDYRPDPKRPVDGRREPSSIAAPVPADDPRVGALQEQVARLETMLKENFGIESNDTEAGMVDNSYKTGKKVGK